MSYFDSKQETINVELTSYGKALLSKGMFKPAYYAFFDDDVVYDSQYMNITESQNEIQQRILNETPIPKPQYTFVGADVTIKKNTQTVLEYVNSMNLALQESELLKLVEVQRESEKGLSMMLPMGKSSPNSNYAPAWSLNCISGTISSSQTFISSSINVSSVSYPSQPYIKIPQINFSDSIQRVRVVKEDGFVQTPEEYENIGFIVDASGDIKTINLKQDSYLFEILEKNVDDIKENFDIEVFIEEKIDSVNTNTPQTSHWKQLNFIKRPIEIKDGILLDIPEVREDIRDLHKNPNFVEHYFRLLIDDEIILPPKLKAKISAYDTNVNPVIGDDC